MSNEIIETKTINTNKIKRKKFFLYSGALAFGIFAASKFPFNILKSNHTANTGKSSSIKITQNPNAVKRNSRQDNNG